MNDERFGELLIKEGLVSRTQLEQAVRIQQDRGKGKPIGQILTDLRVITPRQLDFILDKHRKRQPLGEILIQREVISKEELQFALEEQKSTGLPLGETLVRLSFITEEVMREALCIQLNIAFIDLERCHLPAELKKLINMNYARKHSIIPVDRIGDSITLAMNDPTDNSVVEELQAITGLTINPVTSTQASIRRAFKRLYGEEKERKPGERQTVDVILEDSGRDAEDSLYIDEAQETRKADQIVRDIIKVATEHGASDVHLEALERQMTVRYRIDGVLKDLSITDLEEALEANRRAVISRLKILASLDIAEKRRPQDGSFRVRTQRSGELANLDFRLSLIPGYYGENAVLRVLDQRAAPRSLDQLELFHDIEVKLHQVLGAPEGIFLVTGPTGSGKSTTLFGVLMHLHRPSIKILTAEDPVEYVHDSFIQCEVNERIGNTFSGYLRSFLRHDPEVIMVGEIRDHETAEMAFRAAQTGHLLLSTLHTNDAVSAVTRLRDLGVDKNLIASSLRGVLAQRLVRRICADCRQEAEPPAELLKEFFDVPSSEFTWYRGAGCPKCNYTGYRGRVALGELWIPGESDILLINKGAPIDEIRESSLQGTICMMDDAMSRLKNGETNLEELIRMLPYSSVFNYRQKMAADRKAKKKKTTRKKRTRKKTAVA